MSPDRTIDILLNLESKPKGVQDLTKEFVKLEKEAKDLEKTLDQMLAIGAVKDADKLRGKLSQVRGEIKKIDDEAQKRKLEKSLAAAAKKADDLKNRMEKIGRLGTQMAIAGGAIIAPLTLAMNKYMEAQKALDPSEQTETYKSLVELQNQWNDAVIRLGAIVAEKVLPHLEKAMVIVGDAIGWLERNPGAVSALLGAGAVLLTAGAVLQTVAQVGMAISGVQSVVAMAGGGGAAAGGAAAAGAGGAGGAAALAPAVAAGLQIAGVAVAVVAAAEATRLIFNWATGQSQTWKDIGTTAAQLAVINAEGWDGIMAFLGYDTNFSKSVADAFGVADIATNNQITENATNLRNGLSESFGRAMSTLGNVLGNTNAEGFSSIANGLSNLPAAIGSAIASIIVGARAEGGEMSTPGLYVGGERGREFVMNNSTTRAAESLIGGGLTQERLIAALSGGGSRRVTYNDQRRIDSNLSIHDRQVIRDDMLQALAGAF